MYDIVSLQAILTISSLCYRTFISPFFLSDLFYLVLSDLTLAVVF